VYGKLDGCFCDFVPFLSDAILQCVLATLRIIFIPLCDLFSPLRHSPSATQSEKPCRAICYPIWVQMRACRPLTGRQIRVGPNQVKS